MGIYIFVSVLVIIACFLQVLIVLVQNSKGGGLAANFTSAGQTMGIRKTADFLEKSTWTLAGAIFILCVVATATIPRGADCRHVQGLRIRYRMLLIRMQFQHFRLQFLLPYNNSCSSQDNLKINLTK